MQVPIELVAKVLKIDKQIIHEHSLFGEIPNWDSLNHIKIISELEKNYGIEIPDEDLEKYMSMKAILELDKKIRYNKKD